MTVQVIDAPPSGRADVDERTPRPSSGKPPTSGFPPIDEPRPRPSRATAIVAGRSLIALGLAIVLFLAFEVWVSAVLEARSQRSLLATFQRDAAATSGSTGNVVITPSPGDPIGFLEIPALGLGQVVVEGATPVLLKNGPGHLPGSPLPGQPGNVVVGAHRVTYGGPFRHLDRLRPGSVVRLITVQGQFVYRVSSVSVVRPGEPDVLAPSSDARLTLITTDPPLSPSGRLAVVAKLEGGALPPSPTPPAETSMRRLGFTGDSGGIAASIIWLEILAAALFVAWRLYRRWPTARVAAYLLTTPLILAALFELFSSVDRLLPGML